MLILFDYLLFSIDANQCTLGTHKCDKNAECINTNTSYTCKCNSGYAGDGFTCNGKSLIFNIQPYLTSILIHNENAPYCCLCYTKYV